MRTQDSPSCSNESVTHECLNALHCIHCERVPFVTLNTVCVWFFFRLISVHEHLLLRKVYSKCTYNGNLRALVGASVNIDVQMYVECFCEVFSLLYF